MSTSVDRSLQDAIREFQGALSPDQSNQLQAINAVPDAAAVITFVAQLDEKNAQRRASGVATRLYTILQSVQQFSTIIDTFVSSRPNIAALVWGSVKLTMLIACNFTSYFSKLSTLFMNFNKLCPRFSEYQALYPHSTRLQASLCDFHASIIRCCRQSLQVIQRPWPSQAFNSLWRSFQTEFEPFVAEVQRCSKNVEEEVSLAKAQADCQEQQLQLREREAASEGRKFWHSYITKSGKENEESRKWRIQRDERNARKRTQRLLDSLTSYNHITAFKQARKRRHGNTAQWLTQSQEFNRWMNESGSSVFWCSGKLGSGKTILTANVINNLFLHRNGSDVCIGFFFCRYDEAISLKAEVILRSIIRQSLDTTNLPKDIEVSLEDISQNPLSGIDELQSLLQKKVALSQVYYIVVDALDECEKSERDLVLDVLQSVIALSHSKVKLFLASRDSIGRDIRKQFPSLQHLSMGSPEALSDISTYTRETINGRLSRGDLVVGNRQLVKEIHDALIQGAEGMFLWVAFQIDDICSQHNDEDIRQALRNLPKDLTETFNRALYRILAKGDAKTVKQVFRWVAAAKRPLSLGELREAIAIEPGQPYSKPERLLNDMSRVPAWCENLIVVDEEDEVVQFAHHTVQQYLLGKPLEKRLSEFHFQLQDADHDVGEICVTYLNFNDFKTQLIRQPKFQAPITPIAILETALRHRAESTVATSLFQSVVSRRRQKTTKVDVAQQLADYGGGNDGNLSGKLQPEHPFLDYASENWLLHTTNFEHAKSKTWSLWTQMLLDEQSLGQKPWTQEEFIGRDLKVGKWICDENHSGLLRLIQSSDRTFSAEERTYLIRYISIKGDPTLYEHFSSSELTAVLHAAAEAGHVKMVDTLVAAKVDVNAAFNGYGRTVLQVAAGEGHVQIVHKLLATKADVNVIDKYYQTALQAAAKEGHIEIVDKLLTAKADVNAMDDYGQTALHIAAKKGHVEIVDKLLAAKADVNAAFSKYGPTALQIAAQEGHGEIVDRLLARAGVESAVADDYRRDVLRRREQEEIKKWEVEKGKHYGVDMLDKANVESWFQSGGLSEEFKYFW